MSMFNRNLKIGEGKKYDTSQISADGITKEERAELEKKNKRLIDIFKAFDADGNGELSKLELAAAMDAFSRIDANGDKKLSKKEFAAAAEDFNAAFGTEIESKDLKAFMKAVGKSSKGDEKVSTQGVIDDYKKEQLEAQKKAEAEAKAKAEAEAEAKAKAEQEAKAKAEQERLAVPTDYTVQRGESFNDLLKRSLEAQGKEVNEENLAEAREEFMKNNPGALKEKNGKEYLLMGEVVKLPGALEDKANGSEIKNQYAAEEKAKAEAREKAEAAKYNVVAFQRNKDGSKSNYMKLKPTGEKSVNGRFYAVDKKGNRYLVAHDGTLLDEKKVARKDAAVKKQKATAPLREKYNALVKKFNAANKSFNAQVAKDGWAANTADAVAGFFGSKNTEDHVKADLQAYKQKLAELKAAMKSGDKTKFNKIYNELSKINIGERVAKYNDSQEKGGEVVKGVTVAVASTAAAIATGGTSLLATAAVAAGATFASSMAVEVSDLATNQIDGDVNAENVGKAAKKAAVEGAVAGATAGLVKGATLWYQGAKGAATATGVAVANTADDVAGAAGRAVVNTADDVAGAAGRAVVNTADDVAGAAGRAAANAADDAAGAAGRAVVNTADDVAGAAGRTAANAADDVAGAAGRTAANAADDAAGAAGRTAANAADDAAGAAGRATANAADDAAGAAGRATANAADDAAGAAGRATANTADDAANAAGRAGHSTAEHVANDLRHTRDLGLDDIAKIETSIENGTLSNLDMSRLVDITKMSRAQLSKMSPAELKKLLADKGGLQKMFAEYQAKFTANIPKGLSWAQQNTAEFNAIVDKVERLGTRALTPTQKQQLADILEVPVESLGKMTKAQYRALSVKFHPDKTEGNEIAKQIFQILTKIYKG